MTPELQTAFVLIVIFQIKHFICDFPLQTGYMLRKVLPTWDFLLPLLLHTAVHGLFTLIVCLYYAPSLWWLAIVDMVAHFLMDRIKAADKYLGRFRDRDKPSYWAALGFDQMIHHLTSTYIVWVIVTGVYI